MCRQDTSEDKDTFCELYTIIQGASTWEVYLTDPNPVVWTADADCKWSGDSTMASLMCTMTESGSVGISEDITTGTLNSSELITELSVFATTNLVTNSGSHNVEFSG